MVIKKKTCRAANIVLALYATRVAVSPALAHAPEQRNGAQQQMLTLSAPKESTNSGGGSVTFIGTATVIIRYAGFTVLTDPNFLHRGDRAPLGYGLSAQRL
ncbi:MAG: hypothetical protein V7642_2147, partial [Burkholderiales bacterium]